MDFMLLLVMLSVTTPSAGVLSVCMAVEDCLCPISSWAWRARIVSRQLMKRAPNSVSADDDMTTFTICTTVRTVPLFEGSAELLDLQKCSTALLLSLVSERYEASLWNTRTMLRARYVIMASGCVVA